MNEYDLYNGEAPSQAGRPTSIQAGQSMTPHAADLEARIVATINAAAKEGMTCDEVEVLLGLKHQTASARIREAVQHGLLTDSGSTRKTRSNRPATVYVRTSQTTTVRTKRERTLLPLPPAELSDFLQEMRALKAQGRLTPNALAVCIWLKKVCDKVSP